MTQLFVDLDGVLADFDHGFENLFGHRPAYRDGPEFGPDKWHKIQEAGAFFRNLRPMLDHRELWDGVAHLDPIILTGVPHSVPDVFVQKRGWVDEHIGAHVHVVGCLSKDKCKHANPGDILIDDWERYRHLWEGMGGRWITHRSARESLDRLSEIIA